VESSKLYLEMHHTEQFTDSRSERENLESAPSNNIYKHTATA
jgi:hypothetical protein